MFTFRPRRRIAVARIAAYDAARRRSIASRAPRALERFSRIAFTAR